MPSEIADSPHRCRSKKRNFAHTPDDIDTLLKAYAEVLPMIGKTLDSGTLRQVLRCEPLVPLFKVR